MKYFEGRWATTLYHGRMVSKKLACLLPDFEGCAKQAFMGSGGILRLVLEMYEVNYSPLPARII